MELYELTVHELKEKLANKEITPEEITKSYLDRIHEKENEVQAFVSVNEKAVEEAKKGGLPIGIKDNICIKGMKTHHGKNNYVPRTGQH